MFRVLVCHLALKAVNLVHRDRLVIPPREVYVRGVEKLIQEECHNHLHAPRPPVDVVSVEAVRVCHRRCPVHLKNVDKVVELSMRVSTHCKRLPLLDANWNDVGQRGQRRLGLDQQAVHVPLWEPPIRFEALNHRTHKLLREPLIAPHWPLIPLLQRNVLPMHAVKRRRCLVLSAPARKKAPPKSTEQSTPNSTLFPALDSPSPFATSPTSTPGGQGLSTHLIAASNACRRTITSQCRSLSRGSLSPGRS
mmetsp:Transcript_22397/g.54470  ORF Transcript_22397/g.54470 Transcript_22397/m.54470 type:complete len:250 (+) Transcript_22397:638-1387(+)